MDETIDKTYRIAADARMISAGSAAVLAGALALLAAWPAGVPALSLVLVAAVFAVSAAANLSNFGDRIELSGEGIRQHNVLLAALGWKKETLLAWSDVAQVARHRRRTLFVWNRAGKKHVFDCVQNFEEFEEEVRRRSALLATTGSPVMPAGETP